LRIANQNLSVSGAKTENQDFDLYERIRLCVNFTLPSRALTGYSGQSRRKGRMSLFLDQKCLVTGLHWAGKISIIKSDQGLQSVKTEFTD